MERSSGLKKHFKEVLFLEAETYKVADRLNNWVAAFVAIVASTWAFLWQIMLMNRAPTNATRLGSGLMVLAVVAGAVFLGQESIQEMGRAGGTGDSPPRSPPRRGR